MELIVPDVDTVMTRAADAGGAELLPAGDTFWGDRYGWVRDPFRHLWALATVKEVLTPEEVAKRTAEMMAAAMTGQEK